MTGYAPGDLHGVAAVALHELSGGLRGPGPPFKAMPYRLAKPLDTDIQLKKRDGT